MEIANATTEMTTTSTKLTTMSTNLTNLSSSTTASTITATTTTLNNIGESISSSVNLTPTINYYTTIVSTTLNNIKSRLLSSSSPTTTTAAAATTSTSLSQQFYNQTNETNNTVAAFTTTATGTTAASITTHTSQPENISRSAVVVVTDTWNNLTRVGETLPKAVTSSLCTTTMSSSTSTEDPYDEFGPPEGVEYIFVPLGVMIFVIVLSAVVIIISRKRKLERLRHRLMPLYNFDPGEEGEDDWETELLDEGFSSRQRRQGYQSMDSEENAELFSPAHMQNLG